ncbi:hypothetical protein K8I28_05560 [bacterium]|nr:hypothetical protein [bacterium]
MTDPNLLVISLTAFVAVFTLLSLLALVMHFTTLIFPEIARKINATEVAVISSTIQTLIPGAKVTRIEETK